MRILIDVQTLYTGEKNRGIGIYTYNWLKTLIQHDDAYRFFLMRRKGDSWQFTFISKHISFDGRLNQDQLWEEANLEGFIKANKIDVVHFTSPLMFDIEVPLLNHINVKKSYLIYDLIPIVMKEEYYNNWPDHIKKLYDSRCELIKKADLLLTISEASKKDLINVLNINPASIEVVYASTNEELYTAQRTGNENKILQQELAISRPFIYSLTGYDPRKNNQGLIKAFSEICVQNSNVDLLISGIKNEQEQEELYQYALKQGIEKNRIMFLGFISSESLLALYKKCEFFVFPSLYEGFGLPVLEAMRVGTPVITTNSSSIVEVAGDAAVLVDPFDYKELAEAMHSMLNNKQMSEDSKKAGLLQSEKFSWEEVTRASLEKFKLFSSISAHTKSREKPALAYFSPLNPQASGISDYSEELLVDLMGYFEIKIFVNGIQPTNKFIVENFEIRDINSDNHELDNIKFRLYHIGNNEIHDWIYTTLKLYPGTVLLHDLNLYGLHIYTTYLRGFKKEFVNELNYNYGARGLEVGSQLIENGTYPESQQFPLYNRVMDFSTGMIVHSNFIKDSLSSNAEFYGIVEVIPQGCVLDDQISYVNKSDLRMKLNINQSKFIIGVFGHVIPNKRLDVIIKSFARLLKTNPETELYIVGHADTEIKQNLSRLSKDLKAEKSIIFVSSPEIEKFKDYIKASDICINLRWPTMGETSATLTRALGYGVPCIVSNVGSYKEYSDDIVWKVDVDNCEEELLLGYMLEMRNNLTLLNEMNELSSVYVKEAHSFRTISEKIYKHFMLNHQI